MLVECLPRQAQAKQEHRNHQHDIHSPSHTLTAGQVSPQFGNVAIPSSPATTDDGCRRAKAKERHQVSQRNKVVLQIVGRNGSRIIGIGQSEIDELEVLSIAGDEDIAWFEVVVHQLPSMEILHGI